jgi:hypothetical protein
LGHRLLSLDYQRDLINELTDTDEFLLVILDACRYDTFDRIVPDYLKGDLSRVIASGRWTAEYTQRTWTDTYDLTYLSSCPSSPTSTSNCVAWTTVRATTSSGSFRYGTRSGIGLAAPSRPTG